MIAPQIQNAYFFQPTRRSLLSIKSAFDLCLQAVNILLLFAIETKLLIVFFG